MKVLISGSSGLIGQAVSSMLREREHEVHDLVRDAARLGGDDVLWQPGSPLEAARIAGFDVIVHLAGRPVAALWTETVKAEIRGSRVEGTATIAAAAAQAFRHCGKPHALICSSAIGYYGSRGDEVLTEESESGLGFLAEVCREWESAAKPAAMVGVRVAHMRTGLVLSTAGGALAKMLPAFRFGVAGKLGNGRQWLSWVSLRDAARAYVFAVENKQVHGALNLTAPNAVTNAEFTRALGRVLQRPALMPIPAFVLRTIGGEMAEETLLASQRVIPKHLLEAEFDFKDPELVPTLRTLLE